MDRFNSIIVYHSRSLINERMFVRRLNDAARLPTKKVQI